MRPLLLDNWSWSLTECVPRLINPPAPPHLKKTEKDYSLQNPVLKVIKWLLNCKIVKLCGSLLVNDDIDIIHRDRCID